MGHRLVNRINPADFAPGQRSDDLRLGHVTKVLSELGKLARDDVVIIGVPEDRGVAINRGRVGAKEGPHAWREAFYRMPVGPRGELTKQTLWDAGDIELGATNGETHEALAKVVARVVEAEALPIVIGGGHDNTFGGIKGVVAAGRTPGLINIDAHLDLRPLEADGQIGSGTPFRRLVDEGVMPGKQIIEFGYQPHAASGTHLAYAKEQGVRCWSWFEVQQPAPADLFAQMLRELSDRYQSVAVSLDLDSIVATAAPGVSAPAAVGFGPAQILALLQLAGQTRGLVYLDVMELNPTYDQDHQTARLAATVVWHCLIERMRR